MSVDCISQTEYAQRRAQLVASLEPNDALLVGPGSSLLYFFGARWKQSERFFACILTQHREPTFICPAFEAPRLQSLLNGCASYEIAVWEEHECPLEFTTRLLGKEIQRGASNLLLDPAIQSGFALAIQNKSSLKLLSGEATIAALRQIKSPAELALIDRAMQITWRVHTRVRDMLRTGITNVEVTESIDSLHREFGADGGSTFTIVSFGSATAVPHGSKDVQNLQPGDMVLVDTGCSLHGYQSDLTRTYVFGDPTPRQREIWQVEKDAQGAAFEAACVGEPCAALDDAARRVLKNAGYGPGYQLPGLPHRTGHGIGLDLHEPPYFVRDNQQPLEIGMCGSIEPMLCLPGEVGVRLEDHFYMSADGPKWFTEPSQSIEEPFASTK